VTPERLGPGDAFATSVVNDDYNNEKEEKEEEKEEEEEEKDDDGNPHCRLDFTTAPTPPGTPTETPRKLSSPRRPS